MNTYIELTNADDVNEFVSAASKCPYEIDLECGRVYLDGKSLLGVMSMGMNRKLHVIVDHESVSRDMAFKSVLKKFKAAS